MNFCVFIHFLFLKKQKLATEMVLQVKAVARKSTVTGVQSLTHASRWKQRTGSKKIVLWSLHVLHHTHKYTHTCTHTRTHIPCTIINFWKKSNCLIIEKTLNIFLPTYMYVWHFCTMYLCKVVFSALTLKLSSITYFKKKNTDEPGGAGACS